MSVEFEGNTLRVVNGVPDISKSELAEWMEIKTKLEALKTAIEKSFKLSWHNGNRLDLESGDLITNAYLLFWPDEYASIVQRLNEEKDKEKANE